MFHPFPAYFFLDDSDVLSIGGAAGPETGLMPGRSTQASLSFLSGTLDSRVAYGRTGPGTYFDANGNLQTVADNVPRFDHSPVSPFAACTSVVFGNWGDNLSAPLNGWLQGFRLWPRTLTDFELTQAST